jgi:hypothetical protein
MRFSIFSISLALLCEGTIGALARPWDGYGFMMIHNQEEGPDKGKVLGCLDVWSSFESDLTQCYSFRTIRKDEGKNISVSYWVCAFDPVGHTLTSCSRHCL